jgi:hypothetical protein
MNESERLMNKKDISELKRRYKKTDFTFTKLSGCYVNHNKEAVIEFKENFSFLEDEELFKYLEISKKVLSGGIGDNLLGLNFSLNENYYSEKQDFLMRLKKSKLQDDAMLSEFFQTIIENFDFVGHYLILLFHDVYDVMVKTSDNRKLDESEETHEYILCAICPMSLSKPALGYFDEDKQIKSLVRDWIVDAPTIGFAFPSFIDRESNVNVLTYYTKNTNDIHPEVIEGALGCTTKKTATMQQQTIEAIMNENLGTDKDYKDRVYIEFQDKLNATIEEQKALYEGTSAEPIIVDKNTMKELLIKGGVEEDVASKVSDVFEGEFAGEEPVAENLINKKIIKASEKMKTEKKLRKRVDSLEAKLKELNDSEDSEANDEAGVILKVNPSKVSQIKTEIINGQRCIVVPIDEDEQATINGVKNIV